MRLDQLTSTPGARRNRKRVGRGDGSGNGTYSGKGIKGQKSRSGPGIRPSFEGGQNPLVKRLPTQRGFTNIFKKAYATVNLDILATRFPQGTEVTPMSLRNAKVIKGVGLPVKVLGRGTLDVPLRVVAHKFSTEARRKIEAAGGSVVEV